MGPTGEPSTLAESCDGCRDKVPPVRSILSQAIVNIRVASMAPGCARGRLAGEKVVTFFAQELPAGSVRSDRLSGRSDPTEE